VRRWHANERQPAPAFRDVASMPVAIAPQARHCTYMTVPLGPITR
jgi:hypothetical protein